MGPKVRHLSKLTSLQTRLQTEYSVESQPDETSALKSLAEDLAGLRITANAGDISLTDWATNAGNGRPKLLKKNGTHDCRARRHDEEIQNKAQLTRLIRETLTTPHD